LTENLSICQDIWYGANTASVKESIFGISLFISYKVGSLAGSFFNWGKKKHFQEKPCHIQLKDISIMEHFYADYYIVYTSKRP
jgi:hypothetical protein